MGKEWKERDNNEGLSYKLSGDVTYREASLCRRQVDGVSRNVRLALDTIERTLEATRKEPTVYLPSHDPDSIQRLERRPVTRAD